MRIRTLVVCALISLPGTAAALECRDWRNLDADGKAAEVDGMIEGHLGSNVGRRYTSENTVAMRACLRGHAADIQAQFDGMCSDERGSPKNALDQIFDRYFLSCVQ